MRILSHTSSFNNRIFCFFIALCLKLNGNGRVQGRKRSQIVQNIHDISTKTADTFREDQVNLPVNCVGNHFLKAKTLFNGSCADALVGCCTKRTNKFTPYKILDVGFPSEL